MSLSLSLSLSLSRRLHTISFACHLSASVLTIISPFLLQSEASRYSCIVSSISLLQPTIDDLSKDTLATECPRILVNPRPSPFGFRGVDIPREAFPDVALDDPVVKDIDPRTWAVRRFAPKIVVPSASDASALPMAERFRLAFVEREERLAPKRAKNARQHRRRAEREWVMTSTDAKSIALASQASKFLHNRN